MEPVLFTDISIQKMASMKMSYAQSLFELIAYQNNINNIGSNKNYFAFTYTSYVKVNSILENSIQYN